MPKKTVLERGESGQDQDTVPNIETLSALDRLETLSRHCIVDGGWGRICHRAQRDGKSVRITGRALIKDASGLHKFIIKLREPDGSTHKWVGMSNDIEVTPFSDSVLLAAKDQLPLMVYV